MDIRELSKKKRIYHIYSSSDGKIHCEKYPVIYVNKDYVYYRKLGISMLQIAKTYNVRENLDEVASRIIYYSETDIFINELCWVAYSEDMNARSFIQTKIAEHNDEYKKQRYEIALKTAKHNLEYAQRKYEELLAMGGLDE